MTNEVICCIVVVQQTYKSMKILEVLEKNEKNNEHEQREKPITAQFQSHI